MARGAGTTAQSSGTAAQHGRPRPVAPDRELLPAQSCAPPTPPLHLQLHRGRLGGCPGASRTALWNPAAAGTRPGPETPRPAAVLPVPCRPAARPTSPAPVAPGPELTSSPGPTAHARASGPGSLRHLRQGPRRGHRPLSVSPHCLSRGLGNHLKPRPLGHAPSHHATPLSRPAQLCADAGAPAKAAHFEVRV